MATATRIGEIIDALVDSWSADPLITSLGDSCTVNDGPYLVDNSANYRLFVGATGLDDDSDPAATVEQFSPHAADVARDETIAVTCAAWYVAGDVDMRAARANVIDLLNRAVAMPRTTQNLGLANVFYVGFDSHALRQVNSKDGSGAIIPFTVIVKCRIYS